MNKKFNFASVALVVAMALFMSPVFAYALDNGVYTCKVTTHYSHPETGVIEDSGGEGSKKLGQSMTEGAVSSEGLFEQTAQGSFATYRFVLMDSVRDVSFFVNDKAVSHQVTQEGTTPDGKTYADLRVPVPSDSTVVKCKMYVEPMDRYVVFFMTVSDFTPGQGDFKTASAPAASGDLDSVKADALSKVEALQNLDTAQRDLFVASIKSAKSAEDVQAALNKANDADAKAKAENELGEAKSAAYKKIDEMNLSPEKAAELKQKVKDAQTVAEVEAVLNGTSNNTVAIVVGVVAAVAVVVALVVKKKVSAKADTSENKAAKSDSEDK